MSGCVFIQLFVPVVPPMAGQEVSTQRGIMLLRLPGILRLCQLLEMLCVFIFEVSPYFKPLLW